MPKKPTKPSKTTGRGRRMPGVARGSLASKRTRRGAGGGAPSEPAAPGGRQWAVLNVSETQFVSVMGGGTIRGAARARTSPPLQAADLLIVRNSRTGQLGVAKARRVHRSAVETTALWLVDPAYRLNGGEYRTGRVVWVERPNLPPKARRIARRLVV